MGRKMKNQTGIILFAGFLLFLSGCAHYQSSGYVSITPARSGSEQINSEEFPDPGFDTWRELQILSELASETIERGSSEIRYHPDTSLLQLSVTTSNPERSAALCNEILTAYADMTNDLIRKEIRTQAPANH